MPRQARLNAPGQVHHVMARGIEGCDIFRSDEDRDRFLSRLADILDHSGGARLYAWTLMSNHFHLLIRPGVVLLSRLMRRLLTGHAVSYNMRYKRKGHLFQNRYKSIIIEEEPYFLELVRYIHLNPVRAGIVTSIEELGRYPYAGHAVILGKREFPPQDIDIVLARFSRNRRTAVAAYKNFVNDGFNQGRREELRGGGVIRSSGAILELLAGKQSDRDRCDERILGKGEFVEALLHNVEALESRKPVEIHEILNEVSEQTGVKPEEILGAGNSRSVSAARRRFYIRAQKEAGASTSQLARLTGRSHVAVMKAINKAEYGGGQ